MKSTMYDFLPALILMAIGAYGLYALCAEVAP